MWGMIVSLVQGIVTGVVGPVFTYLGKKQDVTVEGAKAAFGADQVNFENWTKYEIQIESLKVQANNWWGPRFLYMIVGLASSIYVVAVILDSIPFWHHDVGSWGVAKLPPPIDSYVGWVVASLFVVSVVKGPLSAATGWLHRN